MITLAIATTFMAGAIFTGCQSATQKNEAARDKVQDAKEDLKAAENNAEAVKIKTATAEEWKEFKSETEAQIRVNEKSISEFKEKMKKSGKTLDAVYEKKIDALEQQNRDMQARIDGYEKSQSDWESFKSEFNHDMDELGKALKDLTVNNKK